jgi:SRSO17 transposase
VYKTKPQLAIELIRAHRGGAALRLSLSGFRLSVVLADRLYGESGPFISAFHRLGVRYVVAIRSNHGVWMLPGQRIRHTRWRPFERVFTQVFTDGTSEKRFLRETIFGARRTVRS